MICECKIENVNEEEVTINIDRIIITGFCNSSTTKKSGTNCLVELQFFDKLIFEESEQKEEKICRIGSTYEYVITGRLDVDNLMLYSSINFELEKEDIFDSGYLNGKWVDVKVPRIDLDFI